MRDTPATKEPRSRWSYAMEWACFWLVVGMAANAGWWEVLLFGGVGGALVGFRVRRSLFELLWEVLTLRKFHVWKYPEE